MDQKLTNEFSEAIKTMIDTEKGELSLSQSHRRAEGLAAGDV